MATSTGSLVPITGRGATVDPDSALPREGESASSSGTRSGAFAQSSATARSSATEGMAASASPEVFQRAGIFVGGETNRRLIEAAILNLHLVPVPIEEAALDSPSFCDFELIVADEAVANRIRQILIKRDERADGINPVVVAVYPNEIPTDWTRQFEGELCLPLDPATLVAQLSRILYAHRAVTLRYRSALEELELNRQIFRSVTSGISVASATVPGMPLTYVNPAFEVMTGFSLEELMGKNCRILQRDNRDQPGLDPVRDALRDKHGTVSVLRNFRKDGTPFWNELSLSPIYNRSGDLTHFVGIQKDVTQRVDLEIALRESEKLAAVGRLASSIAHEINNPLESVMNLIYLAESCDDVGEIKRLLAIADKELRRVAQITAQSLRFYKQSTRPLEVHPSDLLDSVLDLYGSLLLNANVAVVRRDRRGKPLICLESEIRQVLNNLVRNAIDSMRTSGGRLSIRTSEATDWRSGSPGIAITVADTGCGIGSESLKQIYTAFFTTKGIRGTGLGLWISSEIVARHRGRLLVRSSQRSEASGTIFKLFLPFDGVGHEAPAAA